MLYTHPSDGHHPCCCGAIPNLWKPRIRIRRGICYFFYNGKIPNFLNLTREKLVNRHIFGKKLRMEDVLLIFEQIFALALLVALVTNYTSGFNMKGRSHSSIFAVQTWAKSRTLSFRPLPQVAEQDDQEPHCSQVRTTGDQILDFHIWWDQERLRKQRKMTEPWCFPLRDLLDTFQVVRNMDTVKVVKLWILARWWKIRIVSRWWKSCKQLTWAAFRVASLGLKSLSHRKWNFSNTIFWINLNKICKRVY